MLANQGIYPPNGAAPPAGKVQLLIQIKKSRFFVHSNLRNNIIKMRFFANILLLTHKDIFFEFCFSFHFQNLNLNSRGRPGTDRSESTVQKAVSRSPHYSEFKGYANFDASRTLPKTQQNSQIRSSHNGGPRSSA